MLTSKIADMALRRFLEPGIRRAVGDYLLRPHRGDAVTGASRTAGRAAEAIDVRGLPAAVATRMGVPVPAWSVTEIHTCRDLVASVAAALEEPEAPVSFSACIRPQDAHGTFVLRSGDLTSYDCDALADDALHAGPDALLEVEISPHTSPLGLACAHARLSWLERRGVRVRLRYAGGGGCSRNASILAGS